MSWRMYPDLLRQDSEESFSTWLNCSEVRDTEIFLLYFIIITGVHYI